MAINSGAMKSMRSFNNTTGCYTKTRILVLLAMLIISSQSKAWIAYGFTSGMSRFDVSRHLSENGSLVTTEGAQQTFAGPEDNKTQYNLNYCSRPQKLYLMQFSLDHSLEVFVKTKEKYERRYGEPTPLDNKTDSLESGNWEHTNISFIWDLNESETIVLAHSKNGTHAEFQDLSVCK
ncbi:MAG: hypothetical protein KJO81_09745 [Gammaproteobacteria bacterium]|nr:hypothetical protein [Gammaproteobacteria bacterium]